MQVSVQKVWMLLSFSTNGFITYEALACATHTYIYLFAYTHLHTPHTQGLCGEGEGGKMVDNGDNTYGGKFVINPR